MPKVTITLEDNADGDVDMTVEFDPQLPNPLPRHLLLTKAQKLGRAFLADLGCEFEEFC